MNEVTISKTEGGLKMTHPYILSIDQSTQGTKAMLLDEYGSFLLRRDVPHRQIISDSGWVGHDASEIAANIFRAARLALQDAGVDPAQVAAVAVTNQRESVAVWDRQDRRAGLRVDRLAVQPRDGDLPPSDEPRDGAHGARKDGAAALAVFLRAEGSVDPRKRPRCA